MTHKSVEAPDLAEPGADAVAAASVHPIGAEHARRVAECFKLHQEQLVRWLEFRAGSVAIARDIANETFMTLLQLRQPITDLAPYAYKVAGNALARRMATDSIHRHIQSRMLHGEFLACDSPESELEAQQESAVVRRTLMSLSPRIREAVRLHYYEERTYPQIVQEFAERGITVSTRTVMRWIGHALAECRKALQSAKEQAQ